MVEADWLVWVGGEDELLEFLLLGSCDSLNLGGNDGKGRKGNTVELIKAAPKTTLTDSLEDLGHIAELMLS